MAPLLCSSVSSMKTRTLSVLCTAGARAPSTQQALINADWVKPSQCTVECSQLFFLPYWSFREWATHSHYGLEYPLMIPFMWSQKTLQVVLGWSPPPSSFPFLPSLSPSFLFLLSLPFLQRAGVALPHLIHSERAWGDADLQDQLPDLPGQCHQRLCVQTPKPAWPAASCGQPLWAFTTLHHKRGWLGPILFWPKEGLSAWNASSEEHKMLFSKREPRKV